MFCTKCGRLNEDSARFCGSCGAVLAAPQPVYQQSAPMQPGVYQSVYQVQSWPAVSASDQAPRKEKIPGVGFAITGLVLSLLALGLGTLWTVSTVVALMGIAFSMLAQARAIKVGKSHGLAVGGLVCGLVALAIAAVFGLFNLNLFFAIPDAGLDYSVYM